MPRSDDAFEAPPRPHPTTPSPAAPPLRWQVVLPSGIGAAALEAFALLGTAQVVALSDELLMATLGLPLLLAVGGGLLAGLGRTSVRRSIGVGLVLGALLGLLVVVGLVVADLNACCSGRPGTGV